jgi:hypothetical protein
MIGLLKEIILQQNTRYRHFGLFHILKNSKIILLLLKTKLTKLS